MWKVYIDFNIEGVIFNLFYNMVTFCDFIQSEINKFIFVHFHLNKFQFIASRVFIWTTIVSRNWYFGNEMYFAIKNKPGWQLRSGSVLYMYSVCFISNWFSLFQNDTRAIVVCFLTDGWYLFEIVCCLSTLSITLKQYFLNPKKKIRLSYMDFAKQNNYKKTNRVFKKGFLMAGKNPEISNTR